MAWGGPLVEGHVTECVHSASVSGWGSAGQLRGEIKCLLGSLVNVSNLTPLGRSGGGADGWGREGTQETRRPRTIRILEPGASLAPSWDRGLRAKGSWALQRWEVAASSPESLCDLEPKTFFSGPGPPSWGALGDAPPHPDSLRGCWEDFLHRKGFPPLLSTSAPQGDTASPIFQMRKLRLREAHDLPGGTGIFSSRAGM